jgi:16S rRNA (adenine1518-N6/adenine1519-N6)-dimethyltransferase
VERPKRSLGQNFLVDGNIARIIVDEVRVDPGGTVAEIGPGRGALTGGLADRVANVGARLALIELDDVLAAELTDRYAGRADVTVLHRDALTVMPGELTDDARARSVVGNIPYNLTSPILFHLLERPRPREILVMVQREVADRILAPPGGRAYGALSVGVRAVSAVERVVEVPRTAFRPRPRVDSTVIRLVPFSPPRATPQVEGRTRRLVRALFQWRRKQLARTLRDHPDLKGSEAWVERALAAAGALPRDRPETVSPEGFVAMARVPTD